jgi:hypothetical protein
LPTAIDLSVDWPLTLSFIAFLLKELDGLPCPLTVKIKHKSRNP